jgi:hypothetical protein
MRKIVLAFSFVATLFASGLFAQEAAAAYAAIAYSPYDRLYGRSHGFGSLAGAQRAALAFCISAGGGSCRVVAWARNSCAALAVGRAGWGSYGGSSRRAVQRRALANCRARTGGCRVVAWTCSG